MSKISRISIQRVEYMPKQLEPGILYVAEKFGAVAHLCACGCGAKIRTPLGKTEWAVTETSSGPSLWPSVGNWQQACQSHYIIDRGEIVWCGAWTPEQVMRGRLQEEARRKAHYEALQPRRGFFGELWHFVKGLFGR
jgi:hypothetical protein